MLSFKKDNKQLGFYSTFEEQLSRRHPLYILANEIDWKKFEDAFASIIVRTTDALQSQFA